MKALLMKVLLPALLLSGCAATKLSPPLERMQPVEAQFGLRYCRDDVTLPLQGAVQTTENEGRLGVVFPHGRTLGVCRYQGDGMECVPAEGSSLGMRLVLRQIGLGVYRVLSALTQDSVRDVAQADWSVRWKRAEAGRDAEYRDHGDKTTMEMHFTEIVRP